MSKYAVYKSLNRILWTTTWIINVKNKLKKQILLLIGLSYLHSELKDQSRLKYIKIVAIFE